MKIKPLHQNHGIESVSFGCEWTPPLSPDVVRALGGMHQGALAEQLPAKRLTPLIGRDLVSDSSGMAPAVTAETWLFARFGPDGRPEIAMVLAPAMLSVTCTRYSHWQAMYESFRALSAPFLPIIGAGTDGFTAVGLQYVDVFLIEETPLAFHAAALLNRSSSMLPPSLFDRHDLWHLHQGYFAATDGAMAGKRLTQVNLDLVTDDDRLQLRITTSHRALHVEPIAADEMLQGQGCARLDEVMADMHQENKDILIDLLHPEWSTRVGLMT